MEHILTSTMAMPSLADAEERLSELLCTLSLPKHRLLRDELENLGCRIFFQDGKQRVDCSALTDFERISELPPALLDGGGAQLIVNVSRRLDELAEKYAKDVVIPPDGSDDLAVVAITPSGSTQ